MPGGAVNVCEHAVRGQVAAIVPGVGVRAPVAHRASGKAIGEVVGVGGDERAAEGRRFDERGAVARFVVAVLVAFATGICGTGQPIEWVVGVTDGPRAGDGRGIRATRPYYPVATV